MYLLSGPNGSDFHSEDPGLSTPVEKQQELVCPPRAYGRHLGYVNFQRNGQLGQCKRCRVSFFQCLEKLVNNLN